LERNDEVQRRQEEELGKLREIEREEDVIEE
jgi:hypothetical protein